MTPAELKRDGDALIWIFNDQGIAIGFDQLRETSEGLYGEISVQSTRLNGTGKPGHYHWAKINLASTRARADVIRALKERDDLDWAGLLEIACVKTAETFREGEPVVDLSAGDEPIADSYLVNKLLPEGETSVVFADGGSGKSLFALAVGVAVRTGYQLPCGLWPFKKANVLYLDWETNAGVLRKRTRWLARGFGIECPSILYRPMWRALVDDIDRIRKEVDRHRVGLVIVDSIAPACGGEPENAETITRFFNAMRSLTVTSRFVVSHVSRAGAERTNGQVARPFGSVFVQNLARSVWEMRRSEDVTDSLHVALYHRKVNEGPLHPPMGFDIHFDNLRRAITFDSLEVSDDASLASHTSLSYRVRAALARGKMTTERLATFLDAPPVTIRKTLNRMKDVQRFGDAGGRGNLGEWGLVRPEVSDDLPF